MGNEVSVPEDMLKYDGAKNYQARVAAELHAVWQQARPDKNDGSKIPHLKPRSPSLLSRTGKSPTSSSSLGSEPDLYFDTTHHGLDLVDIANLSFLELPPEWKRANLNSARVIVSEILRHIKTPTTRRTGEHNHLDEDFVEKAAHYTHQQWILDHEDSGASNHSDLIPYYLLSSRTKNLIRRLVRKGIELYAPDKDRLSGKLFPPRAMVIVPLPPIVDRDETSNMVKPWENIEHADGPEDHSEELENRREQALRDKRVVSSKYKQLDTSDPTHHMTNEEIQAHHERDLTRYNKAVHKDVLIDKLHKPKVVNIRKTEGVDV